MIYRMERYSVHLFLWNIPPDFFSEFYTMIEKTVTLYWNLKIERLTLGGALVLRQEGELLATKNKKSIINIYIDYDPVTQIFPERVISIVFESSSLRFIIIKGKPETAFYWPSEEMIYEKNFSYYSFSRLINFHKSGMQPVRLAWNYLLIDEAKSIRQKVEKKLICIHLKRVAPFDIKESNADIREWKVFLSNNNQRVSFIIIGDDPLPQEILEIENVLSANGMSMNLALQLCLVNFSDGFIGMASGICNAANFSKVPHVLFKHPEHHTDDMQRELGDSESFIFSTPKQLLLRKEGNAKRLQEALTFIIN